ncbi:MAG: PASTA domain-containing protein [Actinomycetota bacterium]|nr:PASTA domain-containing protein [Actinomycetota bacterium]
MTDIRESVRHMFDPVPAVGLDEIVAASRRRHRRHRRIVGVGGGLSAAVAVIVVAALAVGGTNSTKVTTGPNSTRPATSSVRLPTQGSFEQITTTPAGRLLLSGTSNTTSQDCITATVDPHTLVISKPAVVPCANPTSSGHQVGMVTHYRKGGPSGLEVDVTIATVSRTGQVVEGPVVMTYTDCSDCRPVSVYGDGLLWIYDNSTPSGGELIEVSDTTGALISTISMPKLFRPLLAANDQGLFIANSIQGGRAAGEPPPSALYHLAPGDKTPTVAVADTSLLACWLTADSTHLWIGMGNQHQGCAQETIWRLDGNNFQPVYETPTDLSLSQPVGDQTGGLWTILWPHPTQSAPLVATTPQLIYIDPATGKATLSTTLPPIQVNSYLDSMQPNTATLLHGDLYVLEPPVGSTGGYTTLTRIDTTTPAPPLPGTTITIPLFVGMSATAAGKAAAAAGITADIISETITDSSPPGTVIAETPPAGTVGTAVALTISVPPAAPCTAAQLGLTYLGGGASAGSDGATITLRDTSPAWCNLAGPVSVTGLDGSGHPVTGRISAPVQQLLVLSPQAPSPPHGQSPPVGTVDAEILISAAYRDLPTGLCTSEQVIPAQWQVALPDGATATVADHDASALPFPGLVTCRGQLGPANPVQLASG